MIAFPDATRIPLLRPRTHRICHRLLYAVAATLGSLLLASAVKAAEHSESASARSAPTVRVSTGRLAGVRKDGISAFLGIPYAAPPVGADRWRAPQPVASWNGVRPATHFAASCWQRVGPGGFGPWTHEYVVQGPVSEDCLYLNIWTPAHRGAHLPVLFWIYGGGFSSGSGSVAIYDGSALARQGIVVVTVNYRLGVLGFLALPALTREAHGAPPGNYGLQDLIAALRWLHHNVAAFGGDPHAITIAGQSAGGMAVNDLIASPRTSGLFARAIAESGLPSIAPPISLARAERAGEAFARSRGVASLAALRALSPRQLAAGTPGSMPSFAPIVDGVLLPRSPLFARIAGPGNDTPILAGMNADEDSAFAPGYDVRTGRGFASLLHRTYGSMAPVFAKLYGVGPSSPPSRIARASRQVLRDRGLASLYAWARQRLRESRRPVYGYLFDHVEPGRNSARYRVFHSSEIPYWFRTLGAAPERPFTALDRRISANLSRYWVSFIKTGDPNSPGLPHWPRMRVPVPRIMQLGARLRPRAILPRKKLAAVKVFLAKGGKPSLL